MPHAFYYSLRDDRRNERPPDVGPNSPWWNDYKAYADYCRRLSWLMANGKQVCHFAILGRPVGLPWRAARVMFETQHDFNYLDTDTLRSQCTVSESGVVIRDMNYQALIVDGMEYVDSDVLAALKPLNDAGRVIAYADPVKSIERYAADAGALVRALDLIVFPDVTVTPSAPGLRYSHLKCGSSDVYVFANEGREPIDVKVLTSANPPREWWDPYAAKVLQNDPPDRLSVPPLQTRILLA